jgi:hypothetical protein
MRKKSASGVLASLRGSTYRSVRLASSLAAALLDGLFAHPASYSDTNTTRELIAAYYAAIEFFRCLLDAGGAPTACAPSLAAAAFSLAANNPADPFSCRSPRR